MIDIIKGKVILTLLFAILTLGGIVYVQTKRLEKSNEQYEISSANEKAALRGTLTWKDKAGLEHSKSVQYENTLREFEYAQDSITKEMYKMLKSTDIRLKKLTQAGYVRTTVDTVLQSNTVFAVPDTTVDLSTKDIINIITFKQGALTSKVGIENSQFLYWSSHKETIEPPRKFFLRRWFQKKHDITEVEIVNSNSLFKVKEQKFVLTEENKKK